MLVFLSDKIFLLTRHFFYVRAFHLLQVFQSLIILIRYKVLSKFMLETSTKLLCQS